jgi:DNA-binding SARP family transcriptional activator
MEFRILGPLEVLDEGKPVVLGTLKERLVLAVLLLHANEFVSRERLIDDLWGEAPPPTARKAVNVYVSKLRKALSRGGADPIATASGGYRLRIDQGEFDADRLQELLGRAHEFVANGQLEGATERFREALALWRGPTLAGLQLESFGRDEVARLDELRIGALMDRIDCDLGLGRHEQVLGELNVLVHEHPLRERLRAQQMLALYRADRQADALAAYTEARRTLVDDLGIDPSEALQRLQQAILRHDPSLEMPEGTAAVNGLAHSAPAPPSISVTDPDVLEAGTRRRFRPRGRKVALAGLVLVAASAAAAAILSASAGATLRVLPNSLVELNPHTGKPILVKQVGTYPGPIAITPSAVWSANAGSDDVSRYDLRTREVDTRGVTPGQPNDIVFDREGNAWVTNTPANDQPTPESVVIRLEAGAGGTSPGQISPSHVVPIQFPLPMAGLEAFGGGHVWVIVGSHGPLAGDSRVAVVNVLTNGVSVLHLDESATAVAYGYDTAWIGTYGGDGFSRATVSDSRIEAFRTGQSKPKEIVLKKHGANWGPVAIAVGDGAVWAVTCCDRTNASGAWVGNHLLKIDPITLRVVRRLNLSADSGGEVAVGAGGVWVLNDHSVSKIDPRTDTIVRTFSLSGNAVPLCDIAATPRQLWVSSGHTYCGTVGS